MKVDQCTHEYSVILEYNREVYNGVDVDFYGAVVMYCPKCGDELEEVENDEMNRILNKQKVRDEFINEGDGYNE